MTVSMPPRPQMPDPILCPKGCGLTIAAEFVEPAFFQERLLTSTNVWTFPEMCEACRARLASSVEEKRSAEDRERREADLERVLGGPRPAQDFTFEKFEVSGGTASAFRACQRFQPSLQNLFLFGKCGVGKTHLATALAREQYLAGRDVLVFKPGNLMRSLRAREPQEQDRRLKRYASADVFVLDDLGVGQATEFYNQALYELLELRENARRNGLVVTTNLSLETLAQKLGDDRLASRLAGLCGATGIIQMVGPDRRVPAAGEKTERRQP